jgi:hypothetical protein
VTKEQRKVKRLLKKMDDLRDQYNAACIAAFPVGTKVSYAHGDLLRCGRVVDTGHGHRLKVEHPSGAAPWIETARIIDEME